MGRREISKTHNKEANNIVRWLSGVTKRGLRPR